MALTLAPAYGPIEDPLEDVDALDDEVRTTREPAADGPVDRGQFAPMEKGRLAVAFPVLKIR
ncbi:MAG: hypothetical protein G01um101431_494 [Parcubacteria group bacterium Gr01-1014_31]|nr:MAG: hypothetical protein G01um101431_494 [Parcubacteria group bacterium Gr01-1014_31]